MQRRSPPPRGVHLALILLLLAAGPCAAQADSPREFLFDSLVTADGGCAVDATDALPNEAPVLRAENRPAWLSEEGAASIQRAHGVLVERARSACRGPLPAAPPPDPRCGGCTWPLVNTSQSSPACPDAVICRPNPLPPELKACFEAWAAASASGRPENFNITNPSSPGQVDDDRFPNTGSAVGYPTPHAADAVMCGSELGYSLSLLVEEVVYQFGNAGLIEMVPRVIERFGERSKDQIRDSVRDAARRRYLDRRDALAEFGPGGLWRALVLEPIDLMQLELGEAMAGVRDLQPNDDPGGSASDQ